MIWPIFLTRGCGRKKFTSSSAPTLSGVTHFTAAFRLLCPALLPCLVSATVLSARLDEDEDEEESAGGKAAAAAVRAG